MTTYNVRHEPKPTPTVTVVPIDPDLIPHLEREWDFHRANPGTHDTVIDLGSAADVARTAAMARRWGQERTPKVEVRKSNRKGDTPETLRLLMKEPEPDAKPLGRPQGVKNGEGAGRARDAKPGK